MSSVWYIGKASLRIITAAVWTQALGAGSYSDISWDATNGWSVPNADLTIGQLAILATDSEFALNQADGPRTSQAPAGASQSYQSAYSYYLAAQQQTIADALQINQFQSPFGKGTLKLANIGDVSTCGTILANAASTVGTSELVFKVGCNATNLSALFDHFYTQTASNPKTDVDPAGSITFSASLNIISSSVPGAILNTPFRLTFRGKITTTLDPGGQIISDPLGITVAPGDLIAIRTYLSAGTGYSPRQAAGNLSGVHGGFTSTTDLTALTTAIPGSTGYYYGPSALLGHVEDVQNAKSALLLGTSIAYGVGDNAMYTAKLNAPGNFAARALSGLAGLINIAIAGDLVNYFLASNGSFRRLSCANKANSAIIEYSTNDFVQSYTYLQVATSNLSLATYLRRLGISKVFLTTCIPRTTSTDNWATIQNQTPLPASEPQRILYNAWIRAKCPVDPITLIPVAVGTANALFAGSFGHPITDTFDTCAKVESAPNSGFWLPASKIATGSIVSGQNSITSSDANFNSANHEDGGDKGSYAFLAGAGAAGVALGFNIVVVSNSTTVLGNSVATNTVNNLALVIGTSTFDGVHPSTRGHNLMSQAIDVSKL